MTWDTVDYRMESRSRSKNRQLDPLRLPRKADVDRCECHVRFVPKATFCTAAKALLFQIVI